MFHQCLCDIVQKATCSCSQCTAFDIVLIVLVFVIQTFKPLISCIIKHPSIPVPRVSNCMPQVLNAMHGTPKAIFNGLYYGSTIIHVQK